jgi:cytochrome bd ubiquinol oxidase subunit II
VKGDAFAGTAFSFLSPFAVASGVGVVAGYALLGASWLIFRTEGSTAAFARMAARPALLLTLVFIAIVSLWTPFAQPAIAARWFSLPNILFLWPVPLLTAFLAYIIWRSIRMSRDAVPFVASILLFLLALLGLGISLFPYAVPRSITIWQAASSTPTLEFLGVGVLIILPVILAYLGYAHWVFRGKTQPGAGYSRH